MAVVAAASRSNACDVGGWSHLMDGHSPEHSCQAGRRTARAPQPASRAHQLKEGAARRAAEELWVVAVDDAADERGPAGTVECPEALGTVTARRGAHFVDGSRGLPARSGNALHGVRVGHGQGARTRREVAFLHLLVALPEARESFHDEARERL